MRQKLKKINGQREKFIGIFERFGTKINYKGFPESTILLKNIKNLSEKKIADHLWFNYTKQFQKLDNLKQGDIIEFEARVKQYVKGYVNYREWIDNREIDYKLSYPTKIKKK
jgi:hypothetical protein